MRFANSSLVSMRHLMLTRVSLLVGLSVLLVSACFVAFGLLPMARQIAQAHFDTARVQVEDAMSTVFDPPRRLLQMSQRWLGGEAPDLSSPDAFNRLFQPVLESSAQITSVVAGTSTGQGWLLLQKDAGAWRNRMTDIPRWGGAKHWVIDWQADGSSTGQWLAQDYDARQRPWFKAAMAEATRQQVGWTAPYTFFTTGDPGITASSAMRLTDGRDFVIGFDLKLRDLSQSTLLAKVGKQGMALVVTDDERVLALPARPPAVSELEWFKRVLKPVAELGLAPVSEAFAQWRGAGRPTHGVLAYASAGTRWLASIRPYLLGNQRFWVLTLAPAADFEPAWLPIISALAVALLVLLAMALGVVRIQIKGLTRPLEQLAVASEKIGRLDFHDVSPISSRVAEIQQLATAQTAMLELLRGNQRTLAERADQLRQKNDILCAIIDYFPGGISMVDNELRVTVYNAQYQQLQALPDTLFDTVALKFEDVIRHNARRGDYGPGDVEQQVAERIALARSGAPYHGEREFANGKVLEIRGIPLPGGGFVASYIDITERKQTEEKLRLAASVFTYTSEAIMITQADGTIIDVNEAFSGITGYDHDEVLGKTPRMFNSGRQGPAFYAQMWRDMIDKGHWHGEIWNRRKNGEVYAEMLTVNAVRGADGVIRQYVALFSDITVLKRHQEQLEHIAHFDVLTNLPNRVLLADRLKQGLAQAQRRGGLLAVAYLDLDGFKLVNDTHGHERGDQLLVMLAELMRQTLREGDTLARLGGDEFVAVLVDLVDVAACESMLNRLLAAAAQPIQVGELTLQVSASLGVTFYPQEQEADADQLLRQADQAMYQAKLAGRNRYHVFGTEQDRGVWGHQDRVDRIALALAGKEFVLHYQPQVNMRSGKIVGAEALIRWQHPDKGLLLPATFLPLIDVHPLAIAVGEWVIHTALAQMADWRAAGLAVPVSVNLGTRQLQQANFAQNLRAMLAQHPQVKPGELTLEVLETSALDDVAGVAGVIDACREMGVTFALDDFGTGYSSLNCLKRLSVSVLKIDQSFVRDMLDDPDDLAILQGVIGLANAFRREVIAEGVESVAHGTVLLQLGCELAQGYGIARPMPAQEMVSWAAAWRPDPMWLTQAPIGREALPLLFAAAELRAWAMAVEAFLTGERPAPPSLDLHQCPPGRWLATDGRARYGTRSAFQRAGQLHRDMYTLAREMVALHERALGVQALARLPELAVLCEALLAELGALLQAPERAMPPS